MDIKTWVTSNLKTSSIVVEAGTSYGCDTRFFSDYLSNGKVYGFEPIPELYRLASQRTNGQPNVELSNKALSSHTGVGTIYVSDRFGEPAESSSLLKPKNHLTIHPEITFKKSIKIETINLDDWFNSKNIAMIDLMWLDLQGYEPIVLQHAPVTLSKTRYLYTEVSLVETYDGVLQYPEFKAFLLNNDFEIVFESLPYADMGDVLFKNKTL